MNDNMIERVGDAIYSDLCGIGTATWKDAYRIARLAIDAMSEPTNIMGYAGQCYDRMGSPKDIAETSYRAMIKRALEP